MWKIELDHCEQNCVPGCFSDTGAAAAAAAVLMQLKPVDLSLYYLKAVQSLSVTAEVLTVGLSPRSDNMCGGDAPRITFAPEKTILLHLCQTDTGTHPNMLKWQLSQLTYQQWAGKSVKGHGKPPQHSHY